MTIPACPAAAKLAPCFRSRSKGAGPTVVGMIRPDLKAIPAYVAGARNDDALKLSSNEAAHPPLPEAAAAMAEAAAQANRYPDIAATALREDLAAHLGVDQQQVAVGTGSSALCQQLVEIAATPGEEILFPWRSFEAYPIFAQVVGAHPIPVPLSADQRVDLPAMAQKITDKTRLIFVCNPNNPSGTTVTKDEFAAFMDAVPADVLVALDEAYIEYNRATDTPLGTELVGTFPNLVCLRTFSKAYGLAGVRIGYAFGPENIIEALNKVAIPFSASTVAQVGARAALAALPDPFAQLTGGVGPLDQAGHLVAAHVARRQQRVGRRHLLPRQGAPQPAEAAAVGEQRHLEVKDLASQALVSQPGGSNFNAHEPSLKTQAASLATAF